MRELCCFSLHPGTCGPLFFMLPVVSPCLLMGRKSHARWNWESELAFSISCYTKKL